MYICMYVYAGGSWKGLILFLSCTISNICNPDLPRRPSRAPGRLFAGRTGPLPKTPVPNISALPFRSWSFSNIINSADHIHTYMKIYVCIHMHTFMQACIHTYVDTSQKIPSTVVVVVVIVVIVVVVVVVAVVVIVKVVGCGIRPLIFFFL